jgi:hypothetical protein
MVFGIIDGTMFLDEYGTVLLEYGANFTYVWMAKLFADAIESRFSVVVLYDS